MTEPIAGLDSRRTDDTASIEPWFRPVLTAGLVGGAADCLGAALLYNVYLRAYSAIHPPIFAGTRAIPGLMTFLSTRAFVLAMGWAVLFAAIYGSQAPIRRRMASVGGFALVAAVFGTVMWLVMRNLLMRGDLEEPALSLVGWLTYVLCAAPAILWAVRRWAPRTSD